MEWVETTAKSVDEAKDLALDQLGVAADEAEFEVLEEPKSGLFGRVRGEARVRARVEPAAVRPKQERRQRGRGRDRKGGSSSSDSRSDGRSKGRADHRSSDAGTAQKSPKADKADKADKAETADKPQKPSRSNGDGRRSNEGRKSKEHTRMEDDQPTVTPQEVGDAAVTFMSELAAAFGVADADTALEVNDTELDVRVSGSDVGLMVGPGGRTLTAVQDLARVAAQRRLGDHETRLRIDVGGYREKRREALEKFAATVAQQVLDTGEAKALEPMASSDRKAVHDAIIEIDGVTSRSEGDDPRRRVVITPA